MTRLKALSVYKLLFHQSVLLGLGLGLGLKAKFYSSRATFLMKRRGVHENNVILRTDDRPTDLAFLKISNGHISATGHPIHFMFDSRVGFSRTADRMDLLPVAPNPKGGRLPSWKISNDHISGMGYLIHFH